MRAKLAAKFAKDALLVFLRPPQVDAFLHRMYTAALLFRLAQNCFAGAKSKWGKAPGP